MKKPLIVFLVSLLSLSFPINAQNVGVGESAPATKLEVKGDSGTDLVNIKDQSNNSRFYIENNGEVGIGTTAPAQKLHVMGNGRFERAAHAAGASEYFIELYSPDTGDPNNEISIRFHQGNRYWGQIRYRTGGFRFTDGSTDNLTSISAGNGHFSGNVGIGTTGPSAQLHTTGTVRFANYTNGLLGVDASGNLFSRAMGVSGTGISIANGNGVSGNPTLSLNYGNSSTGGEYPQGNFGQFQAHSTYTDFNTNPNYWGWNYVQGTVNAPNTISNQWYRGVFSLGSQYNARGSGGYSLELAYPRNNHSTAGVWMRTVENGSIGGWTRIDGAKDNDNFIQNQTSSDQVAGFRINGNGLFNGGNVGIGTTSPAEKIHVSAGNNSYALFGPNSSWNSYLYVGAGPDKTASGRAQAISTNGNLHLDAGTGQQIYIGYYNSSNTFIAAGGGNVGIGNTSPGARLDVSGDIKANGNSTFATNNTTSTSYSVAALELRESAFGGAGALPPRLSFHWGGVVASQIAIESNGTLAIRNNPGTGYEKFRCLTVLSNGIRETSDERLKEEINPINGALDKVKKMQGVTYYWDQEVERNEGLDESLQYGLIAQQLEKVIPELVETDEDGWKSIEYSHLVPVLIEAIKEQQIKMDAMESRHADELNCMQQQMEDYKSMAKDIEELKSILNYSASNNQ